MNEAFWFLIFRAACGELLIKLAELDGKHLEALRVDGTRAETMLEPQEALDLAAEARQKIGRAATSLVLAYEP